jgi:hypothetical protein
LKVDFILESQALASNGTYARRKSFTKHKIVIQLNEVNSIGGVD